MKTNEIEILKAELNKKELNILQEFEKNQEPTRKPNYLIPFKLQEKVESTIRDEKNINEKDKKEEILQRNRQEIANCKQNFNELEKKLGLKTKEIEKLNLELNRQEQISLNFQKEIEKLNNVIDEQNHVIELKINEKEKNEANFEEINNQFLRLKKELSIANKTIEEFELRLNSNLPTNIEISSRVDSKKLIEQLSQLLLNKVKKIKI